MKVKERIIQLLLVFMILISLFLSAKIWTNSGNQADREKPVSSTSPAVAYKPAREVFMPVKLIYHTEDGEHLYTNKESVLISAAKAVGQFKIDQLKRVGNANERKYVKYQTQADSIEFFFASPLTINYFAKITHLQALRPVEDNFHFQRISVNLADKHIYFMLDDGYIVYRAAFTGESAPLTRLLKQPDNRFKKMELAHDFWPQGYLYQEPIELKQYSYILATQSYTLFSKAFFANTGEISLNDANRNNKDVQLMNYDDGENLTISNPDGKVHFSGRITQTDEEKDKRASLYAETYQYVRKIAPSLGTLRYFDSTDTQIIYRNYVEGFPIFGELNRAKVAISVREQSVQIDTNQETIQVPIPSDEEVVLPTTREMLSKLLAAGVTQAEISDFQIGYTWKANHDIKQVVDLSPEWYVKYHGKWVSSANLLDALATGKEGELDGL